MILSIMRPLAKTWANMDRETYRQMSFLPRENFAKTINTIDKSNKCAVYQARQGMQPGISL